MNATVLRISVVCPVYNTPADLLHTAIQSVIATAGPHLHELLLVDDASTSQSTLAAIGQIAAADARVVVVDQRHNKGPGAARNRGIQQATGDWIGFIDSDDVWMDERMEAVLLALQAFPDAAWIAGNYQTMYRDGTAEVAPQISQSCPCVRLRDKLALLRSPELTRHLIGNSWFHMGASLIKKDCIDRIGGFYGNFFHYQEDCILFARLSVVEPCCFLEQAFYTWRRDVRGLMSSPRRLTDAYAAGWRHARRDELLRGFRRETRWALYGVYKGLAVNNLSNAMPWRALRFALRAWLLDPREIGELAAFLRLMLRRDFADRATDERRYSTAERFVLDPAVRGHGHT
jgi:glycosyltransferase involved in cell wall biosynthesis